MSVTIDWSLYPTNIKPTNCTSIISFCDKKKREILDYCAKLLDGDITKEIYINKLCEYIFWFYDRCEHCNKFDGDNVIKKILLTMASILNDKILSVLYMKIFDKIKYDDLFRYCSKEFVDTIMNELINLQIIISESDFENICKYKHIKLIEYSLDNKIIPTKKNYQSLFFETERCKYNLSYMYKYLEKSIEIFLDNGYDFTYDDFLLATNRHIEIKNFATYNFVLDYEFLKICLRGSFYPSYYNKFIFTPKNIEEMLKDETIKLDFIKPYLNNTLPISCLETACNTGKLTIIKYLINECKMVPNKTCLLNIINCQFMHTIKYVVKSYVELNP
jgi:hypothetical protein